MKSIGILLFFTALLHSVPTENYSLYFHKDFLPATAELQLIPAELHGEYQLEERHENDLRAAAGNTLIIDENGILLEKNRLLSISKKEVRENGSYLIRDGYLHGIIDNDSVPAFLDEDRYYFLMPSSAYLFESKADQRLYPGSKKGEFLIFSLAENGGYSLLSIWFRKNSLQLRELDILEAKTDVESLDHDKIIDSDNQSALILKPRSGDWDQILEDLQTYDTYIKEKK